MSKRTDPQPELPAERRSPLVTVGFFCLCLMIALSWVAILVFLVATDAALTAFAVSIAMGCCLLWFGHHLKIIDLAPGREKQIWTVLILSTIGAVATGITHSLDRSGFTELDGLWIETHHSRGTPTCSLVRIAYSTDNKAIRMGGYVFQVHNKNGELYAEEISQWDTTTVFG